MAGSQNYQRSKHGVVQTNSFVLRWFSLSEAPQETRLRGTTSGERPSKMLQPQRKTFKTKRKFATRGVNNTAPEKKKGLEQGGKSEMQHAAVTVNLISSKLINSDEEMELIGEDIDGEEREAAKHEDEESDDHSHSDVETSDFLTESSSEVSDEPILLPNILIPCSKCQDVINICRLSGHRNLHLALQVFKYSHDQRPKSLNTLLKRRKHLIKQQQDASSRDIQDPFGDKHLHKINTAFEVLRSELQGNMEVRSLNDEVIEEIKLNGEGFDLSCATAAGVCEEANKRWKNMEDVHVYRDNFLDNLESAFFAIYDGYSGRNTALECSQHLHVFLKEEFDSFITHQQFRPTKKQVVAAFRSSFYKTERLLLTSVEARSQSRWSGCSAVTCILTHDTCFVANAGNVGAILLRDNDIVKVLTHKHDLYNKKERDRVKKSSGVIVKTEKSALINGALGVTRGIGSIGDMALKKCVINEPYVKSVSLDPSDQLLIVASGGFWKMFSYEETIHLVNGFFGQIRMEAKRQIIEGKKRKKSTSKTSNKKLTGTQGSAEIFLKIAHPSDDNYHCGIKTGYFATNERAITRSKSEVNLNKLSLYHQHINRVTENDLTLNTLNDNETEGTSETTHAEDSSPSFDNVMDDDRFEIEYLRHHRFSLPGDKTLQLLKDSGEKDLSRQEKARLLAKSLAERLVKSALYAESMDNETVFVVLLPGFSMINWQMVRPDILEALEAFVEEDTLY